MNIWLSRRIFEVSENDRLLEELDKERLESHLLEYSGTNTTFSRRYQVGLLCTSVVGGIAMMSKMNRNNIIGVSGLIFGCTVTIGLFNRWIWKKARTLKTTINQMERTRNVLKRRRQIGFSVSMRIPPQKNSLICRCCRLIVEGFEILSNESQIMNTDSQQLLVHLYTDDIKTLVSKSTDSSNILAIEESEDDIDFESVLDTFISLFKLHSSEYIRLVIDGLLVSKQSTLSQIYRYLSISNSIKTINDCLKAIENTVISGERTISDKKTNIYEKNVEMNWKGKIMVALDTIMHEMENGNMTKTEVEVALRRSLLILSNDDMKQNDDRQTNISVEKKNENEECYSVSVPFQPGERTDIDMVFEGVTLSENDKKAARASSRDVLLDGSENRQHEANLLGELQIALVPRRNEHLKRERVALAKFYGVTVDELEETSENDKEEEYVGDGEGIDEGVEPYDWRKDAQETFGIHQNVNDPHFLSVLANRCVKDDLIE